MTNRYSISNKDNYKIDVLQYEGKNISIVDKTKRNTLYQVDSTKDEVSIFDRSDEMRMRDGEYSGKGLDELDIFLKRDEILKTRKLPLSGDYSENPTQYQIIQGCTNKVLTTIVTDGIDKVKVFKEIVDKPYPLDADSAEETYNERYFVQDRSNPFH